MANNVITEELQDDISEITDYLFYQLTYSLAQYISISALIDINEASHRDDDQPPKLSMERMVETMVADASVMFSLLQLTFTVPEYMEKYLHSISSLNLPDEFMHLIASYGATLSEGAPEDAGESKDYFLQTFDRFLIAVPLLISITDEKICSQSNTLPEDIYGQLKQAADAAAQREGKNPYPVSSLKENYNRLFPLTGEEDETEADIHQRIDKVLDVFSAEDFII